MAEQAVTCGGCTGFTQAVNAIHDGVIQHADRDGLTGVKRAVFIDRGHHAPGEVCPTAPPPDPHIYWCQYPEGECICP